MIHEAKMNLTYKVSDRDRPKNIKYRGTKIWNALDEELKSIVA